MLLYNIEPVPGICQQVPDGADGMKQEVFPGDTSLHHDRQGGEGHSKTDLEYTTQSGW